jgi:hypothetical protein
MEMPNVSFWEKALFDLDWPKSSIWKKLRHNSWYSWHIQNTWNEGIWAKIISNFMQGIKSAKLEIVNLELLIPCIEFENIPA